MYYVFVCFVFNDTPTTEIYTSRHTLSLHDALPSALQGRAIPHHCSRDHQQQGRDEDGGSLVPAGRPTPSGRAGATARLRSIVSSMAAQLCVVEVNDLSTGSATGRRSEGLGDRKSTRLNSSH